MVRKMLKPELAVVRRRPGSCGCQWSSRSSRWPSCTKSSCGGRRLLAFGFFGFLRSGSGRSPSPPLAAPKLALADADELSAATCLFFCRSRCCCSSDAVEAEKDEAAEVDVAEAEAEAVGDEDEDEECVAVRGAETASGSGSMERSQRSTRSSSAPADANVLSSCAHHSTEHTEPACCANSPTDRPLYSI